VTHKAILRMGYLLLLLIACISFSRVRANADVPNDRDLYSEVDQYIASEMDELKIPGLEVAIVNKDLVVYTQGYGIADASRRPVTAQTPMILGSLTKGFTALAVVQLNEAGKVDLDSPITAYVPWFRMSDYSADIPSNAWQQITVRQLLNHNSGISEYTGVSSWNSRYKGDDALEKQVRSFADFSLAHIPGSSFEYSNANYQLLGIIVQAVSGESYEAYIEHHIFAPLDMPDSYALVSQPTELATGYRF
jgi:CubicO group peptidase (beta-lactamase class C family)